mgnify:CR=1 FL=1
MLLLKYTIKYKITYKNETVTKTITVTVKDNKAPVIEASNKELDTRETLCICLEMVCRGFYFANIDVDKSDGKKFIITEDQKGLIIPFRALDGLGDNVADAIVKAREGGPFISMEDLRNRGKVNNSALEKLKELGCLDSLPESNQLSLF